MLNHVELPSPSNSDLAHLFFEYEPDGEDQPKDNLRFSKIHEVSDAGSYECVSSEEIERMPNLCELVELEHHIHDVRSLPVGAEKLAGWFEYKGRHDFDAVDRKDPVRVLEERLNPETGEVEQIWHIYCSRGVREGIALVQPKPGESLEDQQLRGVGLPSKDPDVFDLDRDEPKLIQVERWEMGHFKIDNETGILVEQSQVIVHGIEDKPQMCAPSVIHHNGVFHMFVQGACFFDNHPIYHLTSEDGQNYYPAGGSVESSMILMPLPQTNEAGIYDVHASLIEGEVVLVYSAISAHEHGKGAKTEIHMAVLTDIEGEAKAERLIQLHNGMWARMAPLSDGQSVYVPMGGRAEDARMVPLNDGRVVLLMRGEDALWHPFEVSAEKTWIPLDDDGTRDWEALGLLEKELPGSAIMKYSDVSEHNPHPRPPFVEEHDELPEQRRQRLELENNFEWGLEGFQVMPLPNGLFLCLGVCFLRDEPKDQRERAFIGISEVRTGPYVPLAHLVDPASEVSNDISEMGRQVKNGHPSGLIDGDTLIIDYQTRGAYSETDTLEQKMKIHWNLAEARCAVRALQDPG